MKKALVSGTLKECGFQVGDIFRKGIRDIIKANTQAKSWGVFKELSKKFLPISQQKYPDIIELFKGVCEGADIDFYDFWADIVEEMYEPSFGRCSDIAYFGKKTIVGHNNDTLAIKNLSVVTWNVTDFGKFYTIGDAGISISMGLNEYGLVCSGNDLTQNDAKIGVPRFVLYLKALMQKDIESATKIVLDKDRASSYNNILIQKEKGINIEASATDYKITKPVNNFLFHTNHFISNEMREREGKKLRSASYMSSVKRLKCLKKMSKDVVPNVADIKRILSSHEYGKSDNSVCRHSKVTRTCFSFVYDLSRKYFEVSDGNPCRGRWVRVRT